MVPKEKESQRRKLFHIVVGYVIVIGVIATITCVILFFQNLKKNNGNPGKYAEDIKENVLYHVVKVLDGDTLMANVAGHEVIVRLIGINTPETVDPRKPVECFGPEASVKGKELLSDKDIYLEKEASKGDYDIYGRVLAYVKMLNGLFYNEYMIQNGFAREYTFNNEKYKYQKDFKTAQKTAQKRKLGLWGKCSTSF